MSKRRGNDEGTVYYSERDGCWFAQLPADGLGKRPKRRAKTQKEALAKLREMQAARAEGVNLSAKRIKVNALLDAWLEQDVRVSVKESTHESYEQIARLYIRPTFGENWAHKLEPLDIQSWVNTLSERYEANVVRNAHARFRAALEAAITWKKISHNPALKTKLPRQPGSSPKAPPRSAVLAWLEATATHRLNTLYFMAAMLGLRIGELAGLSWRHYDRANRTITIEEQNRTIRGTRKTVSTKNDETRVLPVTREVARRLDAQWELLQREREADKWREHMLIFPSEVGTPLIASNVNRHLRDGLKALNLPHWSMHGFRRFMATRLGELGVSDHIISAILGHTPGRNVTWRYAQGSVEAMRQALELLESDLLKRAA